MNPTFKITLLFVLFFLKKIELQSHILKNSDKIDSLLKTLSINKIDTTYVKNLNLISNQFQKEKKYADATKYAYMAKEKAEVIKFKKGITQSCIKLANIYKKNNNNDSAIYFYNAAQNSLENSANNFIDKASLYESLGTLYKNIGDYKKSNINILNALNFYEKANYKKGIASCYVNLGILHFMQNLYDKTLDYFLKALKVYQQTQDSSGIASSYTNIGIIFRKKNNLQKALDYQLKASLLLERLDNKRGLSNCLNNIANIYSDQKKYHEALVNYKKVLHIAKELDDKEMIAAIYINIGSIYSELKDLNESINYTNNGLNIAMKIDNKNLVKLCYGNLSDLYEKTGDYKQALHYQKLYTSLNDSLFNLESNKQIIEMNTKYETELKDKELLKKDSEIAIQQANSEKQAIIRNGFIIGFIFLLGLIAFVYRGYVQKQKTNKLLNDKNQKITDSINYAKLIQSSILPSQSEVQKYLPNSFVYYQPKDIVSGDFYWMYPINEQTILFAVVDCTGHGVPGAMMSMLGYSLLEQIINQNKTTQPAQILDELHYLVIESLKQSGNVDNIKNGMDMALFKLNHETYELEYAGAKNPVYIVREQTVIELKADRKSIGLSSGNNNPFTNQRLKLQHNDQLYAFSDGYIDQKGGAENKKFYSTNFQKLLISINTLNTNEQAEQLKNTFLNWKGAKEQMDDVSVFGMKV